MSSFDENGPGGGGSCYEVSYDDDGVEVSLESPMPIIVQTLVVNSTIFLLLLVKAERAVAGAVAAVVMGVEPAPLRRPLCGISVLALMKRLQHLFLHSAHHHQHRHHHHRHHHRRRLHHYRPPYRSELL